MLFIIKNHYEVKTIIIMMKMVLISIIIRDDSDAIHKIEMITYPMRKIL